MEYTLVIDPGSTSRKFGFYIGTQKKFHVVVETTTGGVEITSSDNKIVSTITRGNASHTGLDEALEAGVNVGIERSMITSVGLRIVAPGTYFTTHQIVGDAFIKKLNSAAQYAPLHALPIQRTLTEVGDILPHATVVAASDSAFHVTIPVHAKVYAIPYDDTETYDIWGFGYHGLSVASVIRIYREENETLPEKTVVCHLGGGSSITGLKAGKSMVTSMGYSPLEGLPMVSRVGDIDPGALLSLMKQNDFTADEMLSYLNRLSGLKGISGLKGNIPELLADEKSNDRASLALNVFSMRFAEVVARTMVHLGGIDTLIFTGTVGVRSAIMRRRLTEPLNFLGITIDDDLNTKADDVSQTAYTALSKKPVHIATIPTDEMGEVAQIVDKLLKD